MAGLAPRRGDWKPSTLRNYMHLRPRRDDAERFGNAFAAAMAPAAESERAA